MARRSITVCAAVLVGVVAAPAVRADDGGGYLARLAGAVRTRLEEAAATHVVKLVPPVKVAVTWKPQKLGSLDLGAPLVAVASADLDGDGRAELYLVTSREVIAVGLVPRAHELGRVAFSGDPAVPASRDVVGTAVVESGALVAGVSAWAKELRVEWRGKQLTGKPGAAGFRVCGEQVPLAPGRNHFRDANIALYAARCRDDLTDAAGRPLKIRAELAVTGALEIAVARCAAGGVACQPATTHRYKEVGVAFEIADVDRDGTPDLVMSNASAPGDPDAVRVLPLGAPTTKPVFKKSFNAGVAGLAVADGDGDGVAEVLAVVRLAGATRVDVWRMD